MDLIFLFPCGVVLWDRRMLPMCVRETMRCNFPSIYYRKSTQSLMRNRRSFITLAMSAAS